MQSTISATADVPPAPDAARRLLTELHRRGVAISGFEAPPVWHASDPETLRVRLAEYRHFLEVVTLGLAVQLVESHAQRQRLRLALAVEDGSALETDLSAVIDRVESLRRACTDLIGILESVERVAPLLRRDAVRDRSGRPGRARVSACRGAGREGGGPEDCGGVEAGKRGRGEGEDRQGEEASPPCWSCRRRRC